MSRPLRIQYPEAWYHVMNRGRRGEAVFLGKKDYIGFIDLLKEAVDLWNLRISAYCLLENHYHLLVQTPDANLSRCMRHIDGVYTQRFNRAHHRDGPLFRGRYKSILIDADSYLMELTRYIHRNPIEAGTVKRMEKYPWSSHHGYLSDSKKWDWLYKDFLLSMFSDNRMEAVKRYKEFVDSDSPDEINEIQLTARTVTAGGYSTRPPLTTPKMKKAVEKKLNQLPKIQHESRADLTPLPIFFHGEVFFP